MRDYKGFTLLEMMIAAGILVVALVGLLAMFTGLTSMNERSENLTMAVTACQDKLEEIRRSNFTAVTVTYNNTRFDPAGFQAADAEGVIYVDNTNPDLLSILVSVSWRERANRVIGEDQDLDGICDAGEGGGDNRLNSPAQLVTLMAQR